MVGNAIYHVLKIIHKDVFTLCIYNSDLESVHVQLSSLLDATSKDSWQCVIRQVKAKTNKKPVNLF